MEYRLRMPEPHTHLFDVELRVPAAPGPVALVMPSWTPGSYLLREFPRNVQEFRAADEQGVPLEWRKTDKNTWRVEPGDGAAVMVHYRVYANELTVRTSHLDASHAYVNGASVFMYVAGREEQPLALQVEAPAEWHVSTALRPAGGPHTFHVADYAELIDSPLEIGTHERISFQAEGRDHTYAVWGRGNLDPIRLVADTHRIIHAARELWRELPYDDYTFFVHLLPGGQGGLEHRNCCSLQTDRWAFRGRSYEQFLALVAHEFFHVWNATRIRPAALARPDYTRENYTRALWVIEGLTTYYTDLLLRRAGILSPTRYLDRLGEAIAHHLALPGRHVQTLAESSFDAWIKFYRPDAHTPNAQVSYYRKGALVGLLLDLKIRSATRNQRSLDDVMRLAWERYGRTGISFPEEAGEGIEAIASEICDEDLTGFFDRYVRGTAELDFDSGLSAAGLRLRYQPAAEQGTGAAIDAAATTTGPAVTPALPERWLGLRLRTDGSRTVVSHVLDGTPAYDAGVNAGDELLALDGDRVDGSALPARLIERPAGVPISLLLLRRDEMIAIEVHLPHPGPPLICLERLSDPDPLQAAIFADWLYTASDPVPQSAPA